MMTYYEELGLTPAATRDEIRQAYRRLASLLHPDLLQDEKLRQIAECQMKRLGAIVEVLSDDAARRRYDASLRSGGTRVEIVAVPAPTPPPPERRAGRGWWYWAALSVVCGGVVTYYLLGSSAPANDIQERVMEPTRAPAAGVLPSAAPTREPKPRFTPEPEESATVQPVRTAAPAWPSETTPAPPLVSELPPALEAAPASSRPAPAGLAAAPPLPSPAASLTATLEGKWLNGGPLEKITDKKSYQAEYIELVIKCAGRVVNGTYRGRYQVPDQAVSPEVRFHFRGESDGRSARIQWTSERGPTGVGEMVLQPNGQLELRWWATARPDPRELASGSAKLVRLGGE